MLSYLLLGKTNATKHCVLVPSSILAAAAAVSV